MNPAKVQRTALHQLTDLPNIGPSIAADLRGIGIQSPAELRGADALELYEQICRTTGVQHDPCLLDVFLSVTRFLDGEPPRVWWQFTAARKQLLLAKKRTSLSRGLLKPLRPRARR